MKRAKLLLVLFAAGLPALAQSKEAKEKQPPPENWGRKVFVLHYADPRQAVNLLSPFGYPLSSDERLRAVSVTASQSGMAAIEEALKHIDVPAAAPRDVDLTVYLVSATQQAVTGETPPADLQPVITQMKSIFAYKGFRVLDTLLLRGTVGNRVAADGVIGPNEPYAFWATPMSVTDEPQGRAIKLNNLHLQVKVPPTYSAVGMSSDVIVREGQKVVVGKSNMNGPEQALVLVISAKVVP